jgi:hypothetical protein
MMGLILDWNRLGDILALLTDRFGVVRIVPNGPANNL